MTVETAPRVRRLDRDSLPEDFNLPAALRPRPARLSQKFPPLYHCAVTYHRYRRWNKWRTSGIAWAGHHETGDLPFRIYRHQSLLLRQLGESEMWMQHNKVHNLRLAAPRFDGLLIRPGETFSFCRLAGKSSRLRGYRVGMLLDNGEAKPGIGGGICQMANLLHWMVLHTPLTIVERSEHSFDPFPDNGRVLPWGTGCAIYYNYVDLQFRNDTDVTFQLRIQVGEKNLEGELRASSEWPQSYTVYARDEEFLELDDKWYRRNEIWRDVIDKRTGNLLHEELLKKNCALVKYVPAFVERELRIDAGHKID